MNIRTLQHVIPSQPTSDGAGVKLRRSLGQRSGVRLDPFLMLDEFSSYDANDYIAGFPSHPHRGFETVTYMLDGHMLHEDHLGNRGDLLAGGAQWMTAGRGIIHSEMPQQVSGRLRGFQLWLNLPAKEKMKPAHYRDIRPDEIPTVALADTVTARVIAGELDSDEGKVRGPIHGLSTEPLYFDVRLEAGATFTQAVPEGHTVFVYGYEGKLAIGPNDATRSLDTHSAGALIGGDAVRMTAVDGPAALLLLAARPIGEPIAQYGPFVMNTREEIEQAINDYQNGTLA